MASFFCKTGAGYPLKAHTTLAAWLKQVCLQVPGSAAETAVVELYEKRESENNSQESISVDKLTELLGRFVAEHQRTTLIIDGFDELQSTERRILMDCFRQLGNGSYGFSRILLSSRPEQSIKAALDNWPVISVDNGANQDDVAKFIDSELESAIQDRRLLGGTVTNATLEHVKTQLRKGSDGM